jgi:2-keto-4-pentenoate hydratase/2-oxohepta-3-ene-1,7-dioic acid hydratase in catechol pathway
MFLKPPSAMIGSGETILIPPQAQQVNHEAELAVVIGRQGRWINAEEASQYIYGYTAANDITARDLMHRDVLLARSKGFDTFCPLGPWVQTEFDPADAVITCHVNGELRQMASTHEMLFTIPRLIAFASSVMTLNPGDVILTGSPPGSAPLEPGDVVETTIEGIGTLQNKVDLSSAPVAES